MNCRVDNLHRFLAEEQIRTAHCQIAGESLLFAGSFSIGHSADHYVIQKNTANGKRPVQTFVNTPGEVLAYLKEVL